MGSRVSVQNRVSWQVPEKSPRILCSQSMHADTEPLYKELKILDVKNIYNCLVGQFMFRYHNNLLPDVFDSYFIRNNTTHTYETRQCNVFRIPDYKANLGKCSIRYTGVQLWIEIMKSKIDVECSQCMFKQNLQRCLVKQIICLHCSKVNNLCSLRAIKIYKSALFCF